MPSARGYPDTGLGRQLRTRREEMGRTRAEVAAAAGVSLRALVYYEQGQAQPVWPVVLALCAALGCTPDDLLPGGWPG
jgi:transcriptional regulator with XRE-family HTH domain